MSNPTTTAPTLAASKRPRRKRAWKRFIPWVLVIALVAWIVKSLQPKPIGVEVATIAAGPMTVSVLEEGKTRIRHRYTISPPIGGLLERIPFRAGHRIEAGKTVIATIQPQPTGFLDNRSRSQAEARVKAAEAARYQREAQVERARSALELAKKEEGRAQSLRKSGAVAQRDLDAAENQVTVLGRELRAAEFALQVADFERTQAEAALIETQNTTPTSAQPVQIVAPVNGYILNVMEESSRVVAAGTPLMEVGSPEDLEAEIEMLSSDAVGVRPGAEVSIEQWGGEKPLRGRVSVIEPGGYTKVSALGVEEQRVKVRVDFVDPLPSGVMLGDRFRVEARVVIWSADSVLQIPTGALFRMTFLHRDGRAALATVEVGRNNGISAEVRSGVTAGDRVVLHPPDALRDGMQIQPRERGVH
jgi:HlyD family secretion protein